MVRLLTFILVTFVFLLSAGDKVLIWEVTAPALPGKVYLAGSIHSGKAQWYPLDAAYDRALDASSAVYFEIFQPDNQKIAQLAMTTGILRNGTLSQVLGYADFQEVCRFYAKLAPGSGMDQPMMLERFRPWLLTMQISQFYLMKHPEISREYGLEKVFSKNLGKRQGFSLESEESQILAMSKISDKAAGRLLMDGIRDFANAGRDLQRIFRGLETGEIDEIAMIANEMAFKHPEFHNSLFLKRNQDIADKIYRMLKEKQIIFVLVGAGHLAGKGNILEFLREKGCTTIQLKRLTKPGRIKP